MSAERESSSQSGWKGPWVLQNSLCVWWGQCPIWCLADHLASLGASSPVTVTVSVGRALFRPLRFSQEGKSRASYSSGEVIKGLMGDEVRTESKDTFQKFGLGDDRSVCSGMWCWGRTFSKMTETWLYWNADTHLHLATAGFSHSTSRHVCTVLRTFSRDTGLDLHIQRFQYIHFYTDTLYGDFKNN